MLKIKWSQNVLHSTWLTVFTMHTGIRLKCVCDESISFKPNLLVDIIDNVLDDMTVKTLINFDDIEYREEEGGGVS